MSLGRLCSHRFYKKTDGTPSRTRALLDPILRKACPLIDRCISLGYNWEKGVSIV